MPTLPAILSFLLALILTSCSPPEKQTESAAATKWESLPIRFSVDPAISQDKEINADLQYAIDFWNQRAGKEVIALTDDYEGPIPPPAPESDKSVLPINVIFLHPNWPFGNEMAGKTTVTVQLRKIRNAIITLNTNLSYCSGTCEHSPDKVSRRKVMAHELGHALGLKHAESMRDIMYPTATPGGNLEILTVPTISLSNLIQVD